MLCWLCRSEVGALSSHQWGLNSLANWLPPHGLWPAACLTAAKCCEASTNGLLRLRSFKLFPFLPVTPRPFGRLGLSNYWGDVSPSDSTFPAAPSCNCQEIGITKISSWCMELIWESSNPLAEHLDPSTNFRKAKPKWIQVVESWHILTRRKRSCVRKLSCESHNSWEQHAHYQRFSLLTFASLLETCHVKLEKHLPTPNSSFSIIFREAASSQNQGDLQLAKGSLCKRHNLVEKRIQLENWIICIASSSFVDVPCCAWKLGNWW